MSAFEDIRKAELEIRQLSTERRQDNETLKTLLNKLESEQELAVMKYLEASDPIYARLVNENVKLLINDNIEFIITEEEEKVFKSHASRYDGQLNGDGLFYFSATKNDLIAFTFQRGFYPLRYKGSINYFGKAHVSVEKKGYRLFGINSRMPAKFMGSINKEGNMLIETTETYVDGGHYNTEKSISNITADLFSGNSKKRNSFLENTIKLKKSIGGFRSNLNTEFA